MPVRLLQPRRFEDERGWFAEIYNEAAAARDGIPERFVQDNHSLSRAAGTLRGLHFQCPPHAQAKIVRCIRGRVFDVAVDLRSGSPTYGRWVSAELSAASGLQFYIPIGFAHGFLSLEPDCEVLYKVSDRYAPDCDAGLAWNDPTLAVTWPVAAGHEPILSPKDRRLPLFADFDSPFAYDGRPLEPLGR